MRAKADGTFQTSLDFIRDILIHEMELDQARVNIFNQMWKIPTLEGLFLLVDFKGAPKTISNRNAQELVAGEYTEVAMVNTQEAISINIMSRNQEAMQRKEEVLMAINSIYSQQSQEKNGFRIARIAPIENLSVLEGSAMLTRFEIALVVFAWTYKAKTADFYDSFTGEVDAEGTIVDFTQPVE